MSRNDQIKETLYVLVKSRKNASHLAGFEPMTSGLAGQRFIRCPGKNFLITLIIIAVGRRFKSHMAYNFSRTERWGQGFNLFNFSRFKK